MSISIVKQNEAPNSIMLMEYMIDAESEISSLPTNIAPGSIAATADLNAIYRLNNSGTWVKVGGE